MNSHAQEVMVMYIGQEGAWLGAEAPPNFAAILSCSILHNNEADALDVKRITNKSVAYTLFIYKIVHKY